MEQPLYSPIEFYKVDKMSDDILQLTKNIVLRFNVGLSKNINGNKSFFYKEFEFNGRNNVPSVVIKRSYDYYFSLENIMRDSNGNKEYIIIGVKHVVLLERAIETVISWFTKKEFSNLFIQSHGKVSMTSPIPQYVIRGLPANKWILFEPTVLDYVGGEEPGVKLTLSDDNNFGYMDIGTLFALQHILKNFNMYMAAQNMIASLNLPIGFNRVNLIDGAGSYNRKPISNNQPINQGYNVVRPPVGRTIGQSKMGDLEGGK